MNTYGIEKYGIINSKAVYRNLTPAQLVEAALRREEGTLSNTGALVVKTGKYTGRSANDKFIVDTPAVHDDIAWGKVNRPISKENFYAIYDKVVAYLQNKEVFIFDGFAGADPKYTKSFRIINELASQNLFIHQLLRRPSAEQLESFKEDYTIIAAPGFKCIPEMDHTRSEAAILVNYEDKLVVICGTQYAGEIKKSVFSVMNYVLPKEGVFPMHCSANIGHNGDSRHRQDHPVRRPQPQADRRRRARLGGRLRVQLRGRLLRQVHQPQPRRRARNLQRHQVRRAG